MKRKWLHILAHLGGLHVGKQLRNPCRVEVSGSTSEVATQHLPSRGPQKEHNGKITLALSGVPDAQYGEEIRSDYFSPPFSRAHW